jgi:hypothetical protein
MINNDFNNINNLIRMAFDFFYNKNKTICYETKSTKFSDIKNINFFKQILNKNEAYLFNNLLLNNKVTYIKYIITNFGKKYIFKINDDPYSVNITLFIYKDLDKQNNFYVSENLNKIYLKLFSDFLIYQQTRHILLQIYNVDILLTDIEDFILKLNITEFNNIYKFSNINNKIVSINITEHFFKMTFLDDFLNNKLLANWTDLEYKILIFQIIHTLAIILNRYPNFRHNNLLIKYIEGYEIYINNKTTIYIYNNNQYNVPNNGFIFKMNNFENSIIIDSINNEDIDENLKNINKLYDLKIFLNSLHAHISSLNLKFPNETLNFYNMYINNDDNTLNPGLLLNDKYFNKFKILEKFLSSDNNSNKKSKIIYHGKRQI